MKVYAPAWAYTAALIGSPYTVGRLLKFSGLEARFCAGYIFEVGELVIPTIQDHVFPSAPVPNTDGLSRAPNPTENDNTSTPQPLFSNRSISLRNPFSPVSTSAAAGADRSTMRRSMCAWIA